MLQNNNFKLSIFFLLAFCIFSCGGSRKVYKGYDDPDEHFLAMVSSSRIEKSDFGNGSGKLKYNEILVNNSSVYYKVIHRQRSFKSQNFGQVVEEKTYDIKKRFGKNKIEPKGQLFSDKAFFTAKGHVGDIALTVRYCGHRVTKKGKPITNDGFIVKKITEEQMSCSTYTLLIFKKKENQQEIPKEENRENPHKAYNYI